MRWDSITPTPTTDYSALETRAAAGLSARLTAKAPTATRTDEPTATPSPTQLAPSRTATSTRTPSPTATRAGRTLAYVRVLPDGSANVVLHEEQGERPVVLTRFAEPLNLSDLSWSPDGEWLLFVSSHDYIYSRANERNVFMMRPDGTGLRMITGEHADPSGADEPYVTLTGQVIGRSGECRVFARGAVSAVDSDQDGFFGLPGVPMSATWARAVCRDGDRLLEGDIDLQSTTTGSAQADPEPVKITVLPQGRGWRQASLNRDTQIVAGTYYTWTADHEGRVQTRLSGALYRLDEGTREELELPPDATLNGLAWSPTEDKLVGALTGEKLFWLWSWDEHGSSLGPLSEIPFPEDEILVAANPSWSPDGSLLAFEVRHRYWWGEPKYKTNIMTMSSDGTELRVLVASDWGNHALEPSWSDDGASVLYQRASVSAPWTVTAGDEGGHPINEGVWAVSLSEPSSVSLMLNGDSFLPAARPQYARRGG